MSTHIYNLIKKDELAFQNSEHPLIKDLVSLYKFYGNKYYTELKPNYFEITGDKFRIELDRNKNGREKLQIHGLDDQRIKLIVSKISKLESKLYKLKKEKIEAL